MGVDDIGLTRRRHEGSDIDITWRTMWGETYLQLRGGVLNNLRRSFEVTWKRRHDNDSRMRYGDNLEEES